MHASCPRLVSSSWEYGEASLVVLWCRCCCFMVMVQFGLQEAACGKYEYAPDTFQCHLAAAAKVCLL